MIPGKLHFVYGTLMSPEVLKELIGRVPPLIPGNLQGYRRYRIPDQVYPGILPHKPSSSVQGLLVKDLTDSDIAVFDAFEGDDYIKTEVEVSVGGKSEEGKKEEEEEENDRLNDKLLLPAGLHKAWVYVWKPVPGCPLVEDWHYETTFQPHLKEYLEMSKYFRDSLDIPRI